jgi:D-serine deaminase-like pyridoxal phosphate-dependent protein
VRSIGDLPTPALLLDVDRVERNVNEMAARARGWGVELRPHIKTHKSIEVGRLQRQSGATGITVSTLDEARAFAAAGFDDVTWAFPVIPSRTRECSELAQRITLRLVVDSLEAVAALEAEGTPFPVLLKVDCGYHRAGVDPEAPQALGVVDRIVDSPNLRFDGLLTHSGHAYSCDSVEGIRRVAAEECEVMAGFASRLRSSGLEVPTVSVGSTPAMRLARAVPGATEIRPGNYVFFDYMQVVFGACEARETGVSVLATVISSRPDLDRCVVDAGALALSKDAGPEHAPKPTFGEIFDDYEAGGLSPDLRVVSLSQEHGILSRALPVGSRVRILPNHSCLTVACFDEYQVVSGETVRDRWTIHRARS